MKMISNIRVVSTLIIALSYFLPAAVGAVEGKNGCGNRDENRRQLVPGTIGWDGHDDICADENGDFLCYDPNGLWPSGTDVCDSWDTETGECSFGNLSGGIGGGGVAELPAEKEVSVVAPAPTPPVTSTPPRRGDYRRQLVPGTIGWEDRDDICSDVDGNVLCYDPNGLWPLGTHICDTWNTETGDCSYGNMSGGIGGGDIKELPAEKEVSVVVAPAPTPPVTSTPPRRGNDRRQLVPGTIGWGDRNDICSDGDGNVLCYDPNGWWPSGTDVCDSWNTETGECSFGNSSGGIGGGLQEMPAEKEESVVAPAPSPPVTSNPPRRRGDYLRA